MKVLVFGLGVHGGGYAAARYYLAHGDEVRITDLKGTDALKDSLTPLVERGATCITGEHRKEDFLWADIVVKNPSIPLTNPYLAYAKKVVSDFSVLLSSQYIRKTHFIAITGTKGKTTSAYATAHVLEKLGHTVRLCGNMGISCYTVLEEWEQGEPVPEYLVAEMSSWQIRDASYALGGKFPTESIAVITNFYPDHQNSYASLDDYLKDKLKLFGRWTKSAIVPDFLVGQIRKQTHLGRRQVWGIDRTTKRSRKQIQYENAYAILIALGCKPKAVFQALSSFQGVPHRHEIVTVRGNLIIVNDSAATIPEAVAFTCSLFETLPIHLITGGTDKKVGADAMEAVFHQVRSVTLLDGSFTRLYLLPMLKRLQIPFHGPYKTMHAAWRHAKMQADAYMAVHPGVRNVLLLSPGAASFEYFVNEFDRGDQFRSLAISDNAETPQE